MTAVSIIRTISSSPLPWTILAGIFVGAAISRAFAKHPAPPESRAGASLEVDTLLRLPLHRDPPWPCSRLCLRARGALDRRLLFIGAISLVALICRPAIQEVPWNPDPCAAGRRSSSPSDSSSRAFGLSRARHEIAAVRVISADPDSLRLELLPREGQPVLLTMEGSTSPRS